MTTVRVYTKPSCVQCTMTKNLLGAHGVELIEEDITAPGNTEAAKALGLMSAPVVVADDEYWAGFQPEKIKQLAARLKESNA